MVKARIARLGARYWARCGRPREAFRCGLDALEAARGLSAVDQDEDRRILVQALIDAADTAGAAGALRAGHGYAAEAVALSQLTLGPMDRDTAAAWMILGDCCRRRGDITATRAAYRQADHLADQADGAESLRAGLAHGWAAFELLARRPDLAERRAREAIGGRPDPGPECSGDLLLLAAALADLGRGEEAAGALQNARREILGRTDTESAERIALTATEALVRHRGGDRTGAAACYRQAVAEAERRLGADHPVLGELLVAWAEVQAEAGEPAKASALARRARAILEAGLDIAAPALLLARRLAEASG